MKGTMRRFFFVADPVRYDIDGIDALEGRVLLDPDQPEAGYRTYRLGFPRTVFISARDSRAFSAFGTARLEGLCLIEYGLPARYAGPDDTSGGIPWAGADAVNATVLMPDGSVSKGVVERAILDHDGDTVMLEPVGPVSIDRNGPDGVTMRSLR